MKKTIPLIQLENIGKAALKGEVETLGLLRLNHELQLGDSMHKEELA
jgi:hypothetical protein